MKAIEDTITTPPTIEGRRGRAWQLDLAALRRRRAAIDLSRDCTLAIWLIEAPWAHPLWHSYTLILMHLRPVPDLETIIHLPGATHELWLCALDPDQPRQAMLETGRAMRLEPLNFAAQIIEPSDDAARDAVRFPVELICAGRLSPDTDFIRAWVHLFNDSMVRA